MPVGGLSSDAEYFGHLSCLQGLSSLEQGSSVTFTVNH
jgi:hypothetical protein